MTLAENVLAKFEKWVLQPLKADIADPKRSHFNGFILLSVVIDNLACMRYKSEIPASEKGYVGKRYRKFIGNYFPNAYKAHASKLYSGFRCQLVHSFQIDGFDVQQEEVARKHHLKTLKSGDLCLHSQELLKDTLEAFDKFKAELIGAGAKPAVVEAFRKSNYHGWVHTST